MASKEEQPIWEENRPLTNDPEALARTKELRKQFRKTFRINRRYSKPLRVDDGR